MAVNRDIKYINRDFGNLRQSLINYSKTYFPTTYNDFTEASPGMMFMEMASYVGDVLSFYQDNQFQETFLQYAREAKNLYDLAYMMGYKPKVTGAATVDIDFFQIVPSIANEPDYNYALLIAENAEISSTSNSQVSFLVEDPIDFDTSSSLISGIFIGFFDVLGIAYAYVITWFIVFVYSIKLLFKENHFLLNKKNLSFIIKHFLTLLCVFLCGLIIKNRILSLINYDSLFEKLCFLIFSLLFLFSIYGFISLKLLKIDEFSFFVKNIYLVFRSKKAKI